MSAASEKPRGKSKPKEAGIKKPANTPRAKGATSAVTTSRGPISGWIPLLGNKPKVVIKRGAEAREEQRQAERQPPSLWGVVIRLLPVWALLLIILIIEPTLPLNAVRSGFHWLISQLPKVPVQTEPEPVYIVENPEQAPVQNELPPPNWSLEISPLFTPEVAYWGDDIAAWSTAYRIKPNMIATIMQIESCGNPTITSGAGAIGLFQVLPLHFEEGEDPTDPDVNAGRALLYLGGLLATTNGDPGLSFAAYNGGQSMLYTSPADWPTETQNYQYWASGIYEEAELGLEQSPTLADWLDAGGTSLCQQAAQQLGLTP